MTNQAPKWDAMKHLINSKSLRSSYVNARNIEKASHGSHVIHSYHEALHRIVSLDTVIDAWIVTNIAGVILLKLGSTLI